MKRISLFTLIFILFSCEDNTSNTDEVKEENKPIEFSNSRRATFDDWLSFKWTSTDGTLLQDIKITYKTERFMPYYVPMTTLSKN